jgi:hypothetical protein
MATIRRLWLLQSDTTLDLREMERPLKYDALTISIKGKEKTSQYKPRGQGNLRTVPSPELVK